MSEDYRVKKLSDRQVRDIAYRTKKWFRVENFRPVNIIRCLESDWLETEQGRKRLIYDVVDDIEMGLDDARTEFADGVVTIKVKRSVDQKARFGEGRARMTLAHELGHAVMHPGAPKSRRSNAVGATDFAATNASESAEHQAKVFASAFLINDKMALELESAEEISAQFLVSLEAAKIARARLTKEVERWEVAEVNTQHRKTMDELGRERP